MNRFSFPLCSQRLLAPFHSGNFRVNSRPAAP